MLLLVSSIHLCKSSELKDVRKAQAPAAQN